VSIVLSAQFDRAFRGLCIAHPAPWITLEEHTLIAGRVVLGTAAEILRRDLLQFLLGVQGRGVIGP